MTERNPWFGLFEGPVFVLTSDQDWAPEWAVESFLERVRAFALPLHVFRTNPSQLLDEAAGAGTIEQGWHPNFLPGSSHGSNVASVVDYCRRHFPGMRTARSHTFAENTEAWRALAEAGIQADSQLASCFQGHLFPFLHWSGILRLPVYFEDDIFFEVVPDLALEKPAPTLFTPGLKILNFHATFVACNTPSRAHHERHRTAVFGSETPAAGVIHPRRGTADLFDELINRIREAGHAFESFHSIVDRTLAWLRDNPDLCPPDLWPRERTAL